MPGRTFKIFRLNDSDIIDKLILISNIFANNNQAALSIRLADNVQQLENVPLSKVKDSPQLKAIINSDTSFFEKVTLRFNDNNRTSIYVYQKTDEPSEITIEFNNNIPFEEATNLLSAITDNFPVYDPTRNIDKLLGPELSEFYRKREQGLLRLEELSQKLIKQNEEYRRSLDQEFLKKQAEFEDKYNKRKSELESERSLVFQEVDKKKKELEERTKQLDDRDNRHARRDLRNALKGELQRRNEKFNLTRTTRLKRYPIHALFIGLIALLITFGVLSYMKLTNSQGAGTWQDILMYVRFPLFAISIVVTVIFYIRWNDHWAQMHADEEFRLKRLDLDIDRASWVVEMAMEWQEEKGGALPKELLDKLTSNLFTDNQSGGVTNHPYEDVFRSLLSVSAEAKIPLPCGGEIKIDKKGAEKLTSK